MPKFTELEMDWMKQNGPGGWIDDLRNQVATLTAENARLREELKTAKAKALEELWPLVTPIGSWDEKAVPWESIHQRILTLLAPAGENVEVQ